MSMLAGVGYSGAANEREAGELAARRALDGLQENAPVLAWVFAALSHHLPAVLTGVASILGNTPLIGCNAPGVLTSAGLNERGVLVALLSGSSLSAQSFWLPGLNEDGAGLARRIGEEMLTSLEPGSLLYLLSDGSSIENARLVNALQPYGGCLGGGMTAPDMGRARSLQAAGRQSGAGALAAAVLQGRIACSTGWGHGWAPVGIRMQVTQARGAWLHSLDGAPAMQAYANWFGYPAREWAFPPLNTLVRLYPLSVDDRDEGRSLRSPLRAEADGSLRLNLPVREGSTVEMMLGSQPECIAAAQAAARQALQGLGNSVPRLGLVLIDEAWRYLFGDEFTPVMDALRNVLGDALPLAGCTSVGQWRSATSTKSAAMLHQHIQVLLIGPAG